MAVEAEVVEAPTQALAVVAPRPVSGLELWEPEQLRQAIARERALREVMIEYVRSELKDGVHFYTRKLFAGGGDDGEGREGKQKPSLTKEGALNICHLLHCRPGRPEVEREYHEGGHITITTRVPLLSLQTGEVVAEGEGLCSTLESKYAYRWLWPSQVPAAERAGMVTRRFKNRAGQWVEQYRIDNEAVADQLNTVLKMSYKRSLVAGVLQLPTVSEIFTQDLEDHAGDDDDDGAGGESGDKITPESRRTRLEERGAGAAPADLSRLPRSEIRNRVSSRLHALAPGPAGKAERGRLIGFAFGDDVVGWGAVEELPLSKLRVGLGKLLDYTPPPPPADEDDVPLGGEAEAHLAAMRHEAQAGAPVAGASGTPAEGSPPVEGAAGQELGPPTWSADALGYLPVAKVTQLRTWATGLGLLAELEALLQECQGYKTAPQVDEAMLLHCISAVAFAYDAKLARGAGAPTTPAAGEPAYEREPGEDDA